MIDSASHFSSSQDPLNESEETSCMPEIIWIRNSSPSTKSGATLDQMVCDASFPNVSELEASASHSTASKDPVNDSEEMSCITQIFWLRILLCSMQMNVISDETVSKESWRTFNGVDDA
jgi:hypothetical protein